MYQRLPRAMKNIVKKIGRIEARVHKNIVCMRPRLRRRYGRLVYPEGLTVRALKEKKNEFLDFVKHGDADDEEVAYIEDCFSDMERPKFGYRMKVTLMENEPCNIDFENPDQSTCIVPSNSVDVGPNGLDRRLSIYYAQSRQTGEEFRSGAPPDCRIEAVSCDSQPETNAAVRTPTQPTPQPTQPAPQPTQPVTQPTQPAPQPTQPVTQPAPQ